MMLSNDMCRWRLSHHAFFVLLQGLILSQRNLKQSLLEHDLVQARIHLRRIVSMLQASSASMRLAGGMSSERYEEIRTLMKPPHVSPGFSGLWSPDHRLMIEELRQLKPLLSAAFPDEQDEDVMRWHDIVGEVYGAHAHVCEHFVGNSPSLAAMDSDSKKTPLCTLAALEKRTRGLLPVNKSE